MFSHPGNRLFFRTTVINLVYLSVILPVFPDEVDDACVPSGKLPVSPDDCYQSGIPIREIARFSGLSRLRWVIMETFRLRGVALSVTVFGSVDCLLDI